MTDTEAVALYVAAGNPREDWAALDDRDRWPWRKMALDITNEHRTIMVAIESACRKKPRQPWLAGWAWVPSYPQTLERVTDLRRANLVRAKTRNSSFVQLTPDGCAFLASWRGLRSARPSTGTPKGELVLLPPPWREGQG